MFRKKVQGNLKGVGAGDRKDLSKFRNPLRSARSPRNPECMLRGVCGRASTEEPGGAGRAAGARLCNKAPGGSSQQAPRPAHRSRFPGRQPPPRPPRPPSPPLPSPPLPSPRLLGALCWGGGGGVGKGVSSRLTRLSPSLRGHFPRDWQDPGFLLGSFLRSGKLAV